MVTEAEDGFDRVRVCITLVPGSVAPKSIVAPALNRVDPSDSTDEATALACNITAIVFTSKLAL